MSAYNALTGTAIAGTGLYELGKNIQRGLEGDQDKVHFVQNNVTRVEFDASLQEVHGIETKTTDFPVESGAVISDHIIVSPIQLQITAIVSDTPVGRRGNLQQNVFTTALNAIGGPLGVITQNTALRLLAAQDGATSPSAQKFEELLKMCAGDPSTSPPTSPQPFDVITKLRRYPSMVLRQLSVPQDNTTGSSLVFNMALSQVIVVTPRYRSLKVLKAPVVAAGKEEKGEVAALVDKVTKSAKEGVNKADKLTGHEETYKEL